MSKAFWADYRENFGINRPTQELISNGLYIPGTNVNDGTMAEFRAVRQRGRRLTDAFFSLSVLGNQGGCARLGFAIATRTFGSAVARNRIKRLARESFRLNQHRLPPVDVTVTARDAARSAQAKDLRQSLEKHWNKLIERW